MLKQFNQKGFSILEVVVAMAIISVGLLGVSSLVIQNFQVQNVNQDMLVASMLAQEGLELVRNARDSNWYKGGWDDYIYDAGDSTFAIDYDDAPPFDYNPDSINDDGAHLYLNNGLYSHDSSGAATPFYRLITAAQAADGSLSVSCRVQWHERGRPHDYVADTILYNWR